MSLSKGKDLQRDLLGSLLDETDESEKPERSHTPKRVQAFSAPPVFLDFDFKSNFQALDQYNFDSPDPEDKNITEAFCSRSSSKQQLFDFDSFTPPTFRKMSCDSGLLSYYESPSINSFDHYEYMIKTPEQELLNNLSKVCEWSKDQNGSRAVQNIFQSQDMKNKDAVFNIIIKDSKNLIKDRFGNYVFQKVLEKGSDEHKEIIVNSLWQSVVQLSVHPYGCRVIQKAVQFINGKPERQSQLIEQTIKYGLMLIQNQNGNHVIQKCIETFSHNVIEPFADIIIRQLHDLPYHAFGCRVVQKYLENHRGSQKCEFVLKELLKSSVPLSQCQFGNYVMQHVVSKCQEERKIVCKGFLDKIFELSVNKYASNVVEKAIQAPGSNFCESLADWFIINQKEQIIFLFSLILLAKHQFGNYVVQSMLDKVCKEKKLKIKPILKENTPEISKSQYGRHVLMQLDKVKAK